jgi:hypothetical protein
MEEEGVTP